MARPLTHQEAQERAQEKVREALALLEEGIGSILDGESFARYLRCLSQSHQYSISNVGLILMQRPEATRVAGYRAWQALGRQVRKGEKGIAILVPFVSRVRKGEAGDAVQNQQNPAEAVAGGQGKGDTVRVVSRFGVGYVFDLRQTDGEPLPEPAAARANTEATDRGAALWEALAAWLHNESVTVTIEDCGGPNGLQPALQADRCPQSAHRHRSGDEDAGARGDVSRR